MTYDIVLGLHGKVLETGELQEWSLWEETRACPPQYRAEHISQADGISEKTYFKKAKIQSQQCEE